MLHNKPDVTIPKIWSVGYLDSTQESNNPQGIFLKCDSLQAMPLSAIVQLLSCRFKFLPTVLLAFLRT